MDVNVTVKIATVRASLKIDSAWFYRQLEKDGRSRRATARALGPDPSSVSRMLRGERRMTADEQDGIAAYPGVPFLDVAARRRDM